MEEATVLKAVIDYFDQKGAEFFINPGGDDSYEKVRRQCATLSQCEINDSITIGGTFPDLVGFLGQNELVAVEAKGDDSLRKGIGQATNYRRGVHKSYLAAEAGALARYAETAQAAGVGTIPVSGETVVSSNIQEPIPHLAGSEIASTRRAMALKTTEFESGRLVFPPMYRPENALLPVVVLGNEDTHSLASADCEDAIRESGVNYSGAPGNPIQLAKTLQLITGDANNRLSLTDYGRTGYFLVRGIHATTEKGVDQDARARHGDRLSIELVDDCRDDPALIGFLRDRYLATPAIRLLVRILAAQEKSRMEVSRILATITRESPDVFNKLFCADETLLHDLLAEDTTNELEFRRRLFEIASPSYLYNFINQLQVIGLLGEDSDKVDTTADLIVGELYWEWDPEQVGKIGLI